MKSVLVSDSVQIKNTNVLESLEALTQSLASSSEKQANDLAEQTTAMSNKIDSVKNDLAAQTTEMSKKIDAVKIEIVERLVQENEARIAAKKTEAEKAAVQQEQNAAAFAKLNDLISKQEERINTLISIITKFDVSSELEKLSTSPTTPESTKEKKKK